MQFAFCLVVIQVLCKNFAKKKKKIWLFLELIYAVNDASSPFSIAILQSL